MTAARPEPPLDNVRRGPWPTAPDRPRLAGRPLKDLFLEMLGRQDPPERVAASFALGVAIAFTPLLGLHSVLALVLALLLRLRKLDVFLGTLVINPLTLGPASAAAIALGGFLLEARAEAASRLPLGELLSREFWETAGPAMKAIGLQWGVGMLVLSVAAGSVTYAVLLRVLKARQRRRTADPGLHVA